VVRGGSWNNTARRLRSAYRNHRHRDDRNHNLGFRLSRARGDPEDADDQRAILSVDLRGGKKPMAPVRQ
jgi:hypothetical protein